MKKLVRILTISLALAFTTAPLLTPIPAEAQCAMCKLNAENGLHSKQRKTGLGINEGIMLLLAMPYAAVMVVGVLWYKNSRYQKKKRLSPEN